MTVVGGRHLFSPMNDAQLQRLHCRKNFPRVPSASTLMHQFVKITAMKPERRQHSDAQQQQQQLSLWLV